MTVPGPSLSQMVGFDDQSYIVLLRDEHQRMKVEFGSVQAARTSCLWLFAAARLHDLRLGTKKSKEGFGLWLW